jgi:hypothetical protein
VRAPEEKERMDLPASRPLRADGVELIENYLSGFVF